ncbi:MAG: putative Ig domain-containing protein, partial [Gammaproteobacteria bacterium]
MAFMQIISAFKFIFTAVRVLATAAVFTLIVAFAPNAYAADPEIVGSGIADQSVTEDATAAVLDVAGSFTDPDGDTLTFAATLDDGDDDNDLPSFITFSGSEFTFTPTLSSEAGVHSIKVTASDAGRSVSDTFDLTVAAVNDNPVVVTSIADLSAAEDATTTLNVSSNFSDEETVALMATAALSDGSALPGFITFTAMTGEFSFAPTLTTEAGTYSIEVTVSDGTLSISDTFTLTVTAVNDTPVVATVIADQSVTEDATPASLDVSSNFSDEETSALTLSAALADSTALPSFVTFTASTGMFSFEPTLTSEAGSYSIEVTASDGALSVSDTFDLTVAAVNDNPVVATAIASLAAPEDETTTLDVSSNFSDEETSPLTLSAALSDGSALPGFATFTASTGTFSFEPVAADIGTYSIEVTASDGALSISDTFDVTVAAVNASPVVATVIPDQSATEDATVVALDVAGSFSDPDGDTLIFAATLDDGDEDNDLPSFVTFTASTGEFSFAPTLTSEADTYSIKVTASDGALSVSDTFDLVVIAVNDNPVVATAIGDQSASEDATTTLDVSSNFSDEETSSLTLSAALSDSSALPSFATFTASTGMFSFAPTLTSEAGTYSIEVTASDGTLSISDTFTLTVAAVNDNPVVATAIADTAAPEDATTTLEVSSNFSDEETSALTLSAALSDSSALPSFVTFTASTGVFSVAPTLTSDAGTYSIEVTASDGALSISDTFDLTVTAVNDNPVVATAIGDVAAPEDATTALDVSSNFSDEETNSLTLSAALSDSSALPSFATFTASTGMFSFEPVAADIGTYSIKVTASDGVLSISDTFDVTVGAVNDTPVVVTVIPDQSATEDATAATLDVSDNFSDEETSVLTLSAALADSSALPSFVTFTASTGVFSFAPTLSSQADTYSIEVTASDGALSVSDTFDLTVHAVNDNPVVATAIGDVAAPEDETTALDVSASFSDEETNSLTLSAALSDSSALPSFATFTASTGMFSFEPAAADIGTYSIEVTASDGVLSISDIFDVTVGAVNDNPVVVTAIPDFTAVEDEIATFDVSDSFSDEETSALTLSAALSDSSALPSFVTFTASTGMFSFAPTLTSEAGTYSIEVTASDGALSVSDTFDVTVHAVNDNPVVATAISDVAAPEDETTTLDVSANFSDEETNSLTLSAALSDGNALPSFVTFTASTGAFSFEPVAADIGTHSIEVTASDGVLSISDTFDVVVGAVNDNPVVATAIADTAAPEDETTTLDVSSNFTDEETSVLTLSAALSDSTALPSFITFTASTGVFSFAPTLTSEADTYSIEVTASDGALSVSDTFDLTVTAVNDNPVVATAISDVAAPEDDTTTFDVSSNFSDEETNSLTLSAALSDGNALPSFVTFTASTGAFSFEPVAADIGTHSIEVTASDGVLSISDTFDVVVGAVNDNPVVATAIADLSAPEDETTTLDVSSNFTDEETSVLTLSAALSDSSALPSFVTFTASTGVFSFAPTLTSEAGTYSIEVTASDGALSVSDTFDLTVTAVDDNPVVATAIADTAAPEDETTTLDVSSNFSDEETSTLTLSAALSDSSALPSFVTFTASTGMFSFAPTLTSEAGTYSIEVTASDGVLSISDTFDLTVAAVNDNPVVAAVIADQSATEDATAATLDVSSNFSDEETGALTLSAALADSTALPSFATFTASTGMFSFAPTLTSEAGTYSIEVTASDGTLSVSDTFTLTVAAVNDNPVVATAIADTAATEDATTTLDVSSNFSDEETGALTLSAALSDGNALPSFATFTASTGMFSVAPTLSSQAGTYSIEVTASDGALNVSDTFDLTVTPVNDSPVVVTAIADQSATEDGTTTLDVSANFSDEETSALTLSAALADGSSFPSFMSFNATTDVFTFTPYESESEDLDSSPVYEIKVTASDGALSVSDTFELTVTVVNDAPTVSGILADQAVTEDSGATTLDVSPYFEDEESSLEFSAKLADNSALPSFISLSASTGVFSFEPTLSSQAGTYSIEITATDAEASAVSDTFDLTVTAVNDAPAISAIGVQSLPEDTTASLDISSLVSDEEGDSFTLSAALSGGSALPSFVTFTASTGMFSFAPTLTSEAGTYSIEVTASDGTNTNTEDFSLTVTAVDDMPIAIQTIANISILENQTQTVSLDLYFSDEEDADSKNLGYSVTVDGSQPSSSDDA